MVSESYIRKIRQSYYTRLLQQKSTVLFEESSVDSPDQITDFIGEGVTTWINPNTVHCLYKRDISPDEREKYGIDTNVSLVLNISQQELEEVSGSTEFSERIMETRVSIRALFDNEYYILNRIRKAEYFDSIGLTLEMEIFK